MQRPRLPVWPQRVAARLRRLPGWSAYVALGVLVTALGLATMGPEDARWEDPTALTVLLTLAMTLPVFLAAWRPLLMLAIAFGAAIALFAVPFAPNGGLLGLLVLAFAVGARCPRLAVAGAGLALSLAALVVLVVLDPAGGGVSTFVGNAATFTVAWGLGRWTRARGERTRQLEERAARLERERELLAQTAVADERARIARELHDVVAHAVSVMTVQAGAARTVVTRDPQAAAEAMREIETTGRSALGELRRVVGVLRAGGDGDGDGGLEPQPGVADIDALLDEVRRAGLDVEETVDGSPRPLPPAVGLSVYRIVQEALTNVRKHAGPARARVRIDYGDRDVRIRVSDDGRGAAAALDGAAATPGGHGLVGMRERVALFGGDLHVGPGAGGGWVVDARIPLGAA